MNKKDNSVYLFMQEHIYNRDPDFNSCLNLPTPQSKASNAFYLTWTNFIFQNPTTTNLRELKEEDWQIIRSITFGTKNRLQSYICYHLNKDHYDFKINLFSDDECFKVVSLCHDVFNDTKILFDWWRKPLPNLKITGEEWFQQSKKEYQEQKIINGLGFVIIDLKTKQFLNFNNNSYQWVDSVDKATNFNILNEKGKISDQSKIATQKLFAKLLNENIIKSLGTNISFDNKKIFIKNQNECLNCITF